MSERIFLTGSTGFVGGRLAERLLQEPRHELVLLCRDMKRARTQLPYYQHVHWIEGDLGNEQALRQAIEGCTQVYHLAAYAKMWDKDPQAFYRVNVEGAERVFRIAQQAGVQRVVFTSTAGVLGPSLDGSIVDEYSIPALPLSTEYERTKAEAERRIQKYLDKGLDIVIVNPTRVFGPGQLNESNAVTKLIELYLRGRFRFYPGSGHQTGNYAFIDDVVNGHILAMQHGKSGHRYVLGGHNVSYRQFFEIVATVSGQSRRMLPVPLTLMMTLARFEQWKADTFGRAPLITPPFVRKYNHDWLVSTKKAEQEINYKITPLEVAIRRTVEWLKAG